MAWPKSSAASAQGAAKKKLSAPLWNATEVVATSANGDDIRYDTVHAGHGLGSAYTAFLPAYCQDEKDEGPPSAGLWILSFCPACMNGAFSRALA